MSVSTSEGLRQMLGKVIIVLCFLPSLDVIRSMQLKNAFAIQAKYRNDKAGKHFNLLDNERLFDSIKEYQDPEETSTTTRKSKSEITDIKETLLKLLSRINALDKKQNDYYISEAPTAETTSEQYYYTPMSYVEIKKRKATPPDNVIKVQRWGKWTDWSACNVSCGKGRKIRWRHCNVNCKAAETEMEEKSCQLPACSPSKLFGMIKL